MGWGRFWNVLLPVAQPLCIVFVLFWYRSVQSIRLDSSTNPVDRVRKLILAFCCILTARAHCLVTSHTMGLDKSISKYNGCVRLASLGRPCGSHSGELLTRANRTIPRPLVVTSCTSGQPQVTRPTSRKLGADPPGEPLEWRQSYLNVGLPGADRGRPGEANRTHP